MKRQLNIVNTGFSVPVMLLSMALILILIHNSSQVWAADHIWNGSGANENWITADNWNGGAIPESDGRVVFNSDSILNLQNDNNLGSNALTGMTILVTDPVSDVIVSGDSISLQSDANPTIDLSAADRDLTINTPLVQTGFTYYTVAENRTLTLNGPISGDCALCRFRKEGPGLVIVGGPLLSTENWIIQGTMRTKPGFTSADNSFFGLSDGAVLDLDNNPITVGKLGMANNAVVKIGTATLYMNSVNGVTLCRGDFQGTGDISFSGTGDYHIYNGLSYSGNTFINGISLTLYGKVSSSFYQVNMGNLILGAANLLPDNSRVHLIEGGVFDAGNFDETIGTLSGNGHVVAGSATLTVSDNLAPGESSGILSTGNIKISDGASVTIELNGAIEGAGYDQVDVTGTIDLNNSILTVSLGYAPSNLQTFTIIKNDGIDSVVGRFSGLPEGAAIENGDAEFIISYVGGDGNDVVLSFTRSLSIPTLSQWGKIFFAVILAASVIWRIGLRRKESIYKSEKG